jgi:hypothetical protein
VPEKVRVNLHKYDFIRTLETLCNKY